MVSPSQSEQATNGDNHCSQDPNGHPSSSPTSQRPNSDMTDDFSTEPAQLQPRHRSSPANTTQFAMYSTTRPTQKDVLLGRGKPYQNHPGNVNMRRLAMLYKDRYSQAHRDSRSGISMELVDRLLATGAHFLKRVVNVTDCQSTSDGRDAIETWEDASLTEACEKIGHVLRAGRKTTRKVLKKQIHSTSKLAHSDSRTIRDVSKYKVPVEQIARTGTTATMDPPFVTRPPASAGLVPWPTQPVFAGTSVLGLGSLPSTLATPTNQPPIILSDVTIRTALIDRLETPFLNGSAISSIYSSRPLGAMDSSNVFFRGMNVRSNQEQPLLPLAYMDPVVLIALAEYLHRKSV
jgi:hypothetical protein